MVRYCVARATSTRGPLANAGYQRWLSKCVLDVSLAALLLNLYCGLADGLVWTDLLVPQRPGSLGAIWLAAMAVASGGGTAFISEKTPGPRGFWILVELRLFHVIRTTTLIHFVCLFIFFWPCPRHAEVLGQGIESVPWQ